MKKFLSLFFAAVMCLTAAGCGGTEGGSSSAEEKETSVVIQYLAKDGSELTCGSGRSAAEISWESAPTPGDILRVTVTGSSYVSLEAFGLNKTVLYVADGQYDFMVPEETPQRDYPDGTFAKGFTAAASIPSDEELMGNRNIALNPYDYKANADFPHAVANNEYSGGSDPDFLARNAVDGFTQNTGHGRYPYQSWGPDRKDGLEFRIDFGRECEISSVTFYVRADFPHDVNWTSCDIFDDDGALIGTAALDQTAEGQTFTLDSPVVTSSVTFSNMVSPDMGKWSGFTEVIINGKDIG